VDQRRKQANGHWFTWVGHECWSEGKVFAGVKRFFGFNRNQKYQGYVRE
jgi:hypothetical protein